jgi:hypothetical protein
MAFDQVTRNRLSKLVTDTRKLLSDEFAQQMRVKYGLDPATGIVTDIDKLPTMAEGDRQTAQMLRDTLEHYLASSSKRDKKQIATTIDRIVREQAFTVLNRLCAVRMAEARDLVIESIALGPKSKGFQLYARLAGSALGETGEAYVCYLFSLFDELSIDLPVLFDRFSPSGRLFPKESVLLEVLGQINHHEIQHLWAKDETIGWVYQYFNSQEERRAMRDESSAPRNGRELAVRNQFFTPRYVVEFLTDNTLGRIWYEMTQGQTCLVGDCKYLVRRPDEVFLSHMTSKEQEHPFEGTIAMAELLQSGTEETFPIFDRSMHHQMMELGHCVSAYESLGDRAQEILKHRSVIDSGTGDSSSCDLIDTDKLRERRAHHATADFSRYSTSIDAAPAVYLGSFDGVTTQHLMEVLFMNCRNERHSSYGTLFEEQWFVDACNEVRRRVLNSRRDDLSQEELLRQPVFISYRPVKDPRDIKMLDPACGSMHFGLYAFDLFLHIYEEAWELEERLGDRAFVRPRELKSLHHSYGTRENYLLDAPRLIIERNIHGIDIDSRAVQIAGLSLWLRAQKAWYEAGVKPSARPQITQSNIACAEPMPGESHLLEQFITDHLSETSEQQTIASIVRRVFDAMQLAGEAGSLLKIEEEISSTIAEAKKKWVDGPLSVQLPLFEIDRKAKSHVERPLLVAGIDDRSFWDEIEERIYASLKSYAEQTTSGGGFQRRLFAEDAARGFAFIDICRKRYEVVLMNPPFGDWPNNFKQLAKAIYPNSYCDILASFVERGGCLLNDGGKLGAITSRTCFFLSSFEMWRKHVVLFLLKPEVIVDLGLGVMDSAMVESAAYVLAKSRESSTEAPFSCFRLLNIPEPARSLLDMLNGRLSGKALKNTYEVYPNNLSAIPGVPFSYWVTKSLRNIFSSLPSFEPTAGVVRVGVQTSCDQRFVRAWWEVDQNAIIRSRKSLRKDARWVSFSKGGGMSRFYCEFPLVVNWYAEGAEIKEFNQNTESNEGGHWSRNIRSPEYYFSPGLTWAMRASALGVCVMPSGCIFSTNAYGCFPEFDSLVTLAVLTSSPAAFLIDMMLEREGFSKFVPGVVQRLPFPEQIDGATQEALKTSSLLAWQSVRDRSRENETSNWFDRQSCLSDFPSIQSVFREAKRLSVLSDESLEASRKQIDELAYSLYSCRAPDRLAIEERFRKSGSMELENTSTDEPSDDSFPLEITSYTRALVQFFIGCSFGRWDILYAMGEQAVPKLPDPFAPLPVCPPGQLQNAQGLPARQEDVSAAYPVCIPWDGILVDDPNHPLDIERRFREVIEVIWSELGSAARDSGPTAEAIEQEACDILGVKSLRDYMRKPAGFFADHLNRYSKSRRQAPIYLPLSTDSGNYTLWIYYHRLSDQTLYTAVNNFVEPKQKHTDDLAKSLRSKTNRSRADEQELERLTNLAIELEDFRRELLRVADIWKPNLNDGVQITAAPLWKFFRFKKWRDTLKKTWEELEEGKYDWAHLALSIWPDRVVRTAYKDRSIAIAHGLDDVLWHEVEIKKSSKRGRVTVKYEWQPRDLSENELNAIVQRVKTEEFVIASRENGKS